MDVPYSSYLVGLAESWITEERGTFLTHQGAHGVLAAAEAFDDAILARADKIRADRRQAFVQAFSARVHDAVNAAVAAKEEGA